MYFQHIAISGELGSGKSSVAAILSTKLSMPVRSTGQIQREIAARLGLSSLEVNRRSEYDESIDREVDGLLKSIRRDDRPQIFDSRLAWHFVPDAFKVHLVTAPQVAAKRLLTSRDSLVERYRSAEEALTAANERSASEHQRFLMKYGIDTFRLRNYDLVIDSSDVSAEQLADEVYATLQGRGKPGSQMRISPKRVIPTGDWVRELAHHPAELVEDSEQPPAVGYARPFFFALRDYDLLSAQIRSGKNLCPAFLEVEGDDIVARDLTADDYLRQEARMSYIYDWEDVHNFRFDAYPKLAS